jgi:tRNA uridine 5-carbamoylmethylation protein Kti12
MQGAPGSGKSTTAKSLKTLFGKESETVVCSADDFHYKDGEYRFDIRKANIAHLECQFKFRQALLDKKSLVIVDNTNTTIQSVSVYYDMFKHYIDNECGEFKIARPKTPWYFNPNELVRRNTHNVDLTTITNMVNNIKTFSLNEIVGDIVWI